MSSRGDKFFIVRKSFIIYVLLLLCNKNNPLKCAIKDTKNFLFNSRRVLLHNNKVDYDWIVIAEDEEEYSQEKGIMVTFRNYCKTEFLCHILQS